MRFHPPQKRGCTALWRRLAVAYARSAGSTLSQPFFFWHIGTRIVQKRIGPPIGAAIAIARDDFRLSRLVRQKRRGA